MSEIASEQERQMHAAILASAPDIDHAQLLRCYDGTWKLALMQGDTIVLEPMQAAVGDAAGLELMMRMAARLISATEGARQHGT